MLGNFFTVEGGNSSHTYVENIRDIEHKTGTTNKPAINNQRQLKFLGNNEKRRLREFNAHSILKHEKRISNLLEKFE